jgi:hypothetical protein
MSILKQIQVVVLSFTMTMMVIPGHAASREGPPVHNKKPHQVLVRLQRRSSNSW